MTLEKNTAKSALSKANDFLAIASQFQLGDLTTEASHPKTQQLSQLAVDDLPRAIRILQDIDCDALRVTLGKTAEILQLAGAIQQTLTNGHRIYFVGCGATGRLSLSLETLWREALDESHPWYDRVRSFMAGGDVALIRSIENFEDHPAFGERMLEESGFSEGDLLIASTEGGETPYVIGAALHATCLSSQNHWFLYCNPSEQLNSKLERCKKALLNPQLQKLNLTVGPMAISGSTRMQASTVLMLAAGTALFEALKPHITFDSIEEHLELILNHYGTLSLDFLQRFIELESSIYKNKSQIIYCTEKYGITVVTDTTERSPTFSFDVFENRLDPKASHSLSYICIQNTDTSNAAWEKILHRPARPLIGWTDYEQIAGKARLDGYDFSTSVLQWRTQMQPQVTQEIFKIGRESDAIRFELKSTTHCFPTGGLSLLSEHIVLKMILNIHSTLVMGRLGRYQGNVMTYVRPSNFKLIDRSIRYVQQLLQHEQLTYSYEEICHQCFIELETAKNNEPIVMRVYQALIAKRDGQRNTSVGPLTPATPSGLSCQHP